MLHSEEIEVEVLLVLRLHVCERVMRGSLQGVYQTTVTSVAGVLTVRDTPRTLSLRFRDLIVPYLPPLLLRLIYLRRGRTCFTLLNSTAFPVPLRIRSPALRGPYCGPSASGTPQETAVSKSTPSRTAACSRELTFCCTLSNSTTTHSTTKRLESLTSVAYIMEG